MEVTSSIPAFSPIELASMVEATPSSWWRAFITLAATSGLRVREMLWLAWTDLERPTHTVRVSSGPIPPASFNGTCSRPSLPIWRERVVPVPAKTFDVLNTHRQSADSGWLVFVTDWKREQLEPLLRCGVSVSAEALAPHLASHFRYVQRCARQGLALRIDEPMERVVWPVRPLTALRNTYARDAAERYGPAQLAEYLGLRGPGELPASLSAPRTSMGAAP
jgi:hypothetical protein